MHADDMAASLAPEAADPLPQVVDQIAVARLYGEPLFRMPAGMQVAGSNP